MNYLTGGFIGFIVVMGFLCLWAASQLFNGH